MPDSLPLGACGCRRGCSRADASTTDPVLVRSAGRPLPVGHGEDVEHRQVALVLAELELGAAAQRVVRAGIGADATEDAARHVELVRLEDAWPRHERPDGARLRAAAARD